jgi:hypothetical protein
MMNIKRTADVSSLWGAGCFGDEMDSHMPVIEVQFKLEKETKGALRYQEVDEKGEVIEQAWAKIGTLYMRRPLDCSASTCRRLLARADEVIE